MLRIRPIWLVVSVSGDVSVLICSRCCHSAQVATTGTLPGCDFSMIRVRSGYYPIGPLVDSCDPGDMEHTQPPMQQQEPRPRLERLRGDRAVAGVASGLARYLNVDVAWIRIAFVVGALFGGTGVLVYLIGWIAMPEEGEKESIVAGGSRHMPDVGSWIGVGLIALAAMIIVGNTGLVDGDLIFAAALIVFGVLLYRGDLGGRSTRDDEDTAPETESVGSRLAADEPAPSIQVDALASAIVERPVVESPIIESPVVEPPVPPPPPDPAFQPRPPRQPQEASILGRLALASVLIAVGIMGVGQSLGWWDPLVRHYVGTVFVILGAALVMGSVFGRARWLIAVGLIAAPMLFGAALLDVPLEGGFGDPHHSVASIEEVDPEYRLIAGELVIDLTDLDLAKGEVVDFDASVVFGSLRIYVPEDLGLDVLAEMDAGEIRLDGESVGGVNNEKTLVQEGDGLVSIDAHVGFGELVVDVVEETP